MSTRHFITTSALNLDILINCIKFTAIKGIISAIQGFCVWVTLCFASFDNVLWDKQNTGPPEGGWTYVPTVHSQVAVTTVRSSYSSMLLSLALYINYLQEHTHKETPLQKISTNNIKQRCMLPLTKSYLLAHFWWSFRPYHEVLGNLLVVITILRPV